MSRVDEFEVTIRRKGSELVASIPQLGLYANGDSPVAALSALEEKKRAYEAQLKEAGLLDVLESKVQSAERPPSRAVDSDIRKFAMKAGIVIGLSTAAIILCGILLLNRIEQGVDNALYSLGARVDQLVGGKTGGAQFWQKVETEIERAASPMNELPEERKQKMLSNIRVVANRARPFVAEIMSIFPDQRIVISQPGTQENR